MPSPTPPTVEALCQGLALSELTHRIEVQALEHQVTIQDLINRGQRLQLEHAIALKALQHQRDVPPQGGAHE